MPAARMKVKWKKFGGHIRQARLERGLGLRETARSLNIHHATWCRAESGKPVSVPYFLFLCDWMKSNPFQYRSE